MSRFICTVCGEDVHPLDGLLSWRVEGNRISGFALTHRHNTECSGQVQGTNHQLDLYRLATVQGYLDFVDYLLRCWEEGYKLDDYPALQEIIKQVNFSINEKLSVLIGD